MKKLITTLFLLFILPVCAKTADTKTYPMSTDNAFILSLDAISKLGFSVVEMQANSGYILFKTLSNNEYLIMISENGENNSDIKISKVKNSSPLREIQEIFYNALNENSATLPVRVDK